MDQSEPRGKRLWTVFTTALDIRDLKDVIFYGVNLVMSGQVMEWISGTAIGAAPAWLAAIYLTGFGMLTFGILASTKQIIRDAGLFPRKDAAKKRMEDLREEVGRFRGFAERERSLREATQEDVDHRERTIEEQKECLADLVKKVSHLERELSDRVGEIDQLEDELRWGRPLLSISVPMTQTDANETLNACKKVSRKAFDAADQALALLGELGDQMLAEKPAGDSPGTYRFWTAGTILKDAYRPLEGAKDRLARTLANKADAREAMLHFYHRYCVMRRWLVRVTQLEGKADRVSLGAYNKWRAADAAFFKAVEAEIGSFTSSTRDDVVVVDALQPVLRGMRTLNEHAGCRQPAPDLPKP